MNRYIKCIQPPKSGKRECPADNVRMHYVDLRRFVSFQFQRQITDFQDAVRDYAAPPGMRIGRTEGEQKVLEENLVKKGLLLLSTVRALAERGVSLDEAARVWKEMKRIDPRFERAKGVLASELTNYVKEHAVKYADLHKLSLRLLLKFLEHPSPLSASKLSLYCHSFISSLNTDPAMDTYALARLFHHFDRLETKAQPAYVKNAIFYTGALHTENYERVLKQLGYKQELHLASVPDTLCMLITVADLEPFWVA